MKYRQPIVAIILISIPVIWFKYSKTEFESHREITVVNTTPPVYLSPNHPNREIETNTHRLSNSKTKAISFDSSITHNTLEFEKVVPPRKASKWIRLYSHPKQGDPKNGPQLLKKVAICNLSEIPKLDFFLIRAFGDDEQRLLRHVVYDVSKREGIDLLFCGDCIEEGSNELILWHNPELDITPLVIEEFLRRVK